MRSTASYAELAASPDHDSESSNLLRTFIAVSTDSDTAP
ncbi:Uncharacterised protein [Mycobacteroides abscessus subsp. abscessus]|nr:Uncharacterised protein [Mycobacteroides abscessus subsp. abscessus]